MAQTRLLTSIGIYSVPEAARLTGVTQQRIRRWIRGYTFSYRSEVRQSPPVWERQLPSVNGTLALGFLDLMEVRFVNAFRAHGVSWKTLRLAAERARELFDATHPFCTKRFTTDGRSIFAEIREETGEAALVDVVRSQYAFRQVLAPYLHGVEYDAANNVVRWWPLGQKRRVVVDPRRSLGQPIVQPEGVPTSILANAYRHEEDVRVVADWYAVSAKSVKDAVEFEGRLAA